MLERNSGMRRLSMDWKCQFSVCLVLRRLWSIWVDVFGFRNKTAAWSPESVPGVHTPRNPFVLSPHYFPTKLYFTGEFPSSFTGNLYSVLTRLVLPGESWTPFWALVNSYFFLLRPLPCHPELCVKRGLAVWAKSSRIQGLASYSESLQEELSVLSFQPKIFFSFLFLPLPFPLQLIS